MKRQERRLVEILRETIVSTVRQDAPDLSARQLAVLLACTLDPRPYSVRGLAGVLNVHTPAITRALDRLELLELARRAENQRDRRSVLVVITPAGRTFVEGLGGLMAAAERQLSADATRSAG